MILLNEITPITDVVRLENPWALFLLIAIPIVLVSYFVSRYVSRTNLNQFISQYVQPRLIENNQRLKKIIQLILAALILFFITLGCANLQYGVKEEIIKRKGIDIMICLDVSKSMNAEDLKPSRLKRAKNLINQIIKKLGSDRIGIVVFAGGAYIQLPITTDHGAAKMMLESIDTDLFSNQGTAIGAAIEKAESSFKEDDSRNKAIIVISDGEDHIQNAEEAAEKASKNGAMIFTIGVGTAKGSTIPVYRNGKKIDIHRHDGSVVTSRLNEAMLRDIAEAGGGRYFNASESKVVKTIYNELNQIDKAELGTLKRTEYDHKFETFLWIAFALMVIMLTIEGINFKSLNG